MAEWWNFVLDGLTSPLVMGALGAFVIEAYLRITKELKGFRYGAKMGLGIFVGFLLAYVLQADTAANAFAIGVGWEATLSSMAKESHFKSVSDDTLMRELSSTDCPRPEESLETALDKMKKAGTMDRIPVVNAEGRIMGLITDGMIRRRQEAEEQLPPSKKRDLSGIPIEEVMHGATQTVRLNSTDSVAKALKVVDQRPTEYKGLPVIDKKGKVLGLVVTDDLRDTDRPLLEFGA